MKRNLIFIIIALLVPFFFNNNCVAKDKKDVPSYIYDLVFKGQKFSESIEFCFGHEDDRRFYNRECNVNFTGGGLFLPKLIYCYGYESQNKKLISYLISNGLAEVQKCTRYRDKKLYDKHHFIFFTDKLKALIDENECYGVGKRKLKSIDYTNEYKGSPCGIEMKFYALTFTYVIDGNLLNLSPLNKKFEGKAKAFLDPDDGNWKLMNIDLGDSGRDEFMKQIEDNFSDYKPQ